MYAYAVKIYKCPSQKACCWSQNSYNSYSPPTGEGGEAVIGALRRVMPTGNITEAPELGTPHYQGQSCWSQWCPLYRGSTLYKPTCDFPPVKNNMKVQLLKDYFTLIVYVIESLLSRGADVGTLQMLFMSVLGVVFT